METCHYCEKEDSAEYTCPECEEYTCEDCFVDMTQFNAGDPLPCKTCESERAHRYHAESDRLYAEEQTKAEKRKKAAITRTRNYYSPEATAKRAAKKEAKRQAKLDQQRKVAASVAEAMSGFMRFF